MASVLRVRSPAPGGPDPGTTVCTEPGIPLTIGQLRALAVPGRECSSRPGRKPARTVEAGVIEAGVIVAGAIPELDNVHRAAGSRAGVRLAYRQMSGWRVNRATLTEAVRRYAPDVPVTDC